MRSRPSEDDISWDDLHPQTQRLLTRRGFLGGVAGAGAAITFLGFTVACSSTDTATSGATTTASAAKASTTTAAGGAKGSTPGGKTLYERLGGNAAITVVVGDFLTNVGNDPRINKFFTNTNLDRLKKLLIEQIGEATGGPEKYTGRSMKETHAGLKITTADFNALVDDLTKALQKNNVPQQEQTELLNALAGMQGDIVTA